MGEQNRILVGYDASASADAALIWAAASARAENAQLCVRIVVSELDPVVKSSRAVADLYASRRRAKAVALLEDLGAEHADVEVVHGPVFPSLLAEAGADGTLVVGSEGHAFLSGLVHGSVSQEVARHGHGPVVVVRECFDPESHRIVVGVDGGPASLAALRWSARRASLTGEDLLTVTVVEGGRRHHREVGAPTERAQQGLDLAVLRLRRELASLRRAFPQVRPQTQIRVGVARDLLLQCSDRATLLVLGAHTEDPLLELARGSTVQHLLTRARCPVALVHAPRVPTLRIAAPIDTRNDTR